MAAVLLSLILGLGITYLAVTLLQNQLNKSRQPPLPPGPKGLPLLGNLNDFPKPGTSEAHHWSEHKKLYGPISSVTVWGQTIIIINDARIAIELLEKRSVKYSSRPQLVFAGELVGLENTIVFSPNNRRHRIMRKSVARAIGSVIERSKGDIQMAEAAHFLLHVLESPADFLYHIRKAVGATILKMSYGYTAEAHQDDILISMISDIVGKASLSSVPGAFMVDLFPFLKRVPDWVPGTAWKKIARQWAAETMTMMDLTDAFVRHQMAHGMNETSFMSELINAGDSDPETVAAIECFYLAMTIYPEVQRRGQEEIDRVIGKNRLPTLADRGALTYIDAIVKETLRWHPVTPIGFPHQTTEDDVFEDHFIPKGSMLLANIWQFTHDPELYPSPETFKPDRFLTIDGHEPETDPREFVFGFGRRICAGMDLADQNIFLIIAQSLAVFDISRSAENGMDAECKPKFQYGVVTHPSPFKSTIKPRSPHHKKMIKSLEDVYPWQQSDGRTLERIAHEGNQSADIQRWMATIPGLSSRPDRVN
ncbi:putative cytochrome P450 oxidoreductase OrdA-like protein [Xylaria intraflava]|nr:putative cytochrome P450 oxidoreductase OrdA-like protein [Xylaria intraflava]